MPITHTVHQTPKGHTYLRTVSSGYVSKEDAEALLALTARGQPLHGTAYLALVEPGSDYSPEARKTFTTMNGEGGQQSPVAIVVTSAPLRVLLSFIIRISGAASATRFFGTEDEARSWLLARLDGA